MWRALASVRRGGMPHFASSLGPQTPAGASLIAAKHQVCYTAAEHYNLHIKYIILKSKYKNRKINAYARKAESSG